MGNGSKSRRWIALALSLAAMAVLVGVLPSGAVLSGSTFEGNDGNLVATGTNLDWDNVGISCGATKVGCGIDTPTGSNDDSFGSGANNKEDGNPPPVTTGSIPNNKSDLTRFYVANRNQSSKNFLFLAWERVQDPNGTTNMDFEFNQSSTTSANGVTPVRTAGDLLVNYDLSSGGSNPTLGYRRWITSDSAPSGSTAATLCEASNSFPCWGKVSALTGANFEGSINTAATDDPILATGQSASRTLSARTFGEASINLTDSGILTGGTCQTFGSAFLKSRSSDTFTSALKDYIAPIPVNISNCGKIRIQKNDDAGTAMNGVTFDVYKDNAPLGGTKGAEDTLFGSCTTTSTTTPATNGYCEVLNVPFASYWVRERSAPAGYTAAADQYVTVSSGTPNPTILTFVNTRNPASVTLLKQDDTGAALGGAGFTLYRDAAPVGGTRGAEDTSVAGTCTTQGVATPQTIPVGQCTISNVLPAGSFWLVETTVPSGYAGADDQAITLSLGQALDLTGTPIVDHRLFKVVTLVCQESTGGLYGAKVAYDGAAVPSTANTPDAGGLSAATEAEICGLTGTYVHGGVQTGSHSSSVSIP